jgi:hypothetical protein
LLDVDRESDHWEATKMTTIKRRKFTRTAVGGVAAGAAMTTVAAPAISQQRQEWRMVTSWP